MRRSLFGPRRQDGPSSLAAHFAGLNTLRSVFIERLVPWAAFVRPPNPGHAAVADFLIARAAVAGISSNYDILIERQAWEYGSAFRGSLDGDEANLDARRHGPLLKLHGCSQRDPASTVWARSQLEDATIATRIEKSKTWMAANLREKDLLVIGFWSDWDYLNAIIGSALEDVQPLSVTVIDPTPAETLQQKAPELWQIAHAENVMFEHIQESGAAALDELRRAFSLSYVRQVLHAGRIIFEQETAAKCDPAWLDAPDFDSETLYGWRRDAEGVPGQQPATRIRPGNCEALGFFHLLLRRSGAVQRPDGYELNGRLVRVINGAGEILSMLRARFLEPPATPSAGMVVAVGATDVGVPSSIVRAGTPEDIIRPDTRGAWFDLPGARAELDI